MDMDLKGVDEVIKCCWEIMKEKKRDSFVGGDSFIAQLGKK